MKFLQAFFEHFSNTLFAFPYKNPIRIIMFILGACNVFCPITSNEFVEILGSKAPLPALYDLTDTRSKHFSNETRLLRADRLTRYFGRLLD